MIDGSEDEEEEEEEADADELKTDRDLPVNQVDDIIGNL